MRGTTHPRDTAWMDQDPDHRSYLFSQSGAVRAQVPLPGKRLQLLRQRLNDDAMRDRPSGRTRRAITYVRTGINQEPGYLLAALRRDAANRGLHVAHELHDECGPLAPQRSPKWLHARKLMHEGYADGVLVLDRDQISRADDEYEAELRWIAQEARCFTVLVRNEAMA